MQGYDEAGSIKKKAQIISHSRKYMVYFRQNILRYIMNVTTIQKGICVFICVILIGMTPPALSQDHISELDIVRSAIINQGNSMPALIREATTNQDIRTLERIYELNTSLLVTIESYFRMLKLVVSSRRDINGPVIDSLNEWLAFINNQCRHDIDYLQSAITETADDKVKNALTLAKINIEKLSDVTQLAISENKNMLN